MPEGDSIAKVRVRLQPLLEGRTISALGGTSGSVRVNAARIRDSVVQEIRTVGKNLIVDFSSGYSLHVHLGMNGRWRINPASHGSARVVLTTDAGSVACFGAPTVLVDRTPAIDRSLDRLGPDVLGESFNAAEAVARAQMFPDEPIGRVLLDQRVVSGIGNVYKSELAFLAGIHPDTLVSRLGSDSLQSVFDQAATLLRANVRPGARNTTGDRAGGRQTWVYGNSGRPCRRCGSRIEEGRRDTRITYWCPTCQPEP